MSKNSNLNMEEILKNVEIAVCANAFYSKNFDEVEFVQKGVFCIDKEGMIIHVFEYTPSSLQMKDVQGMDDQNEADEKKLTYERVYEELRASGKLIEYKDDEFMIPGFVDLHIHAPQFPQSGMALDRPLEHWLQDYTFPLEAKYEDVEFAKEVYEQLVKSTLKRGTTSALYFATVHLESSIELAKICQKLGQRGFVGKVVMDDVQENPSFYRDETTQKAIEDTRIFIEEVLKIQNNAKQKVYPVVTPRFVPSCTDRALEELGKLAKQYDVHIQTHCSESDWQHQYSIDRFGKHDAFVLDDFGLITDKTVLAHSVFLSEEDAQLFAQKNTSLAHCPLSNVYFSNAVMPLKKFHKMGVNVGGGTDISGGYATSMYASIRQAVISSRMLQDGVDPSIDREKRGVKDSAITLNNAFYMATVAGAKALNLPVGKLEKGYIADFQLLSLQDLPIFGRLYEELSPQDILDKILLLSESSNIKEVWVQGSRVI